MEVVSLVAVAVAVVALKPVLLMAPILLANVVVVVGTLLALMGVDQNPTGGDVNDGTTYWQPQGDYDGTICTSKCLPNCDPEDSCISETYTKSCTLPGCPTGDDPTPTPTSNPTSVIISGNIQYDNDAAAAVLFALNQPLIFSTSVVIRLPLPTPPLPLLFTVQPTPMKAGM